MQMYSKGNPILSSCAKPSARPAASSSSAPPPPLLPGDPNTLYWKEAPIVL